MTRTVFILATALLLAPVSSAFAWSTGAAPSGPDLRSQFSDPDEALDNIANPSADSGGGTELNVTTDGTGSTSIAMTARPQRGDAEPINPGWPLWMQWHQN